MDTLPVAFDSNLLELDLKLLKDVIATFLYYVPERLILKIVNSHSLLHIPKYPYSKPFILHYFQIFLSLIDFFDGKNQLSIVFVLIFFELQLIIYYIFNLICSSPAILEIKKLNYLFDCLSSFLF